MSKNIHFRQSHHLDHTFPFKKKTHHHAHQSGVKNLTIREKEPSFLTPNKKKLSIKLYATTGKKNNP
jgi:hypothetical protein